MSQGSWLFPQVYGLPGPDLHAVPTRVCPHSPAVSGQRDFSGRHCPPSAVLPSVRSSFLPTGVLCGMWSGCFRHTGHLSVSQRYQSALFARWRRYLRSTQRLLPPEASGVRKQQRSVSQLVPGHPSWGFGLFPFGGGEGGCEQAVGLLPTGLLLQPRALQPRGLSSGGCQGSPHRSWCRDVFQQEEPSPPHSTGRLSSPSCASTVPKVSAWLLCPLKPVAFNHQLVLCPRAPRVEHRLSWKQRAWIRSQELSPSIVTDAWVAFRGVLFSSSEIKDPASQVFKVFPTRSLFCALSLLKPFRGRPPTHTATPCARSSGSAEPDPSTFEAFLWPLPTTILQATQPSHRCPMPTPGLFAPITHATLLAAMPSLQSLLHCHHLPLAWSPAWSELLLTFGTDIAFSLGSLLGHPMG